MKLKIIYLFLFLPALTYANDNKKPYFFDHLTLTLGNWMDFIGSIQEDSKGEINSFFDSKLTPYVAIAAEYNYYNEWSFIPQVGYIFERYPSKNVTKNQYMFKLDLTYQYNSWLRIRTGTSLMILTITGLSGEQQIGGNTFFIPRDRSTALNQTLDFGVEFLIDRISLKFENYFYAITSDLERMSSYSFSFNYRIPLEEI